MNNVVQIHQDTRTAATHDTTGYLTFVVANQHFAVRAVEVRDVLRFHNLTPVPLARPEVAGLMNLRGHIVTAFDLRVRLGLTDTEAPKQRMSIVVERGQAAYCLVVDRVGDVIGFSSSELESTPSSVNQKWAALSKGVFKQQDNLIILVDIGALLALPGSDGTLQ